MKGVILLNQNESPFPPPENVVRAISEAMGYVNRYPDPKRKKEVEEKVAEYLNVDKELVTLIPGADTIVDITSRALKIRKYIIPDPTFYDIIIDTFDWNDVEYRKIPLEKFEKTVEKIRPVGWKKVVLVDNPNNPMGIPVFKTRPNTEVPLIIDEAYYEFSDQTLIHYVEKEENIGIIRTFSKAFGLAGLRLGAAVFPTAITEKIRKDPLIFRISSLSIAALEAALEDPSYVKQRVSIIIKERERLIRHLMKTDVKVYPSLTNFVTIDTGLRGISMELRKRNIIVKSLEEWIKPGMIRVTVGLPEENTKFLETLEEIISEKS